MIEYKDLLIRIVLSFISATFIVLFNIDEEWSVIIRSVQFLNAMLASFIIAFLLLYVIWLITRYLDRKYNWLEQPVKRTLAQVSYGVIIPCIFAIFLAAVYFRMYGHDIRNTSYFSGDFPVIVILLIMANVYYFCYFMVVKLWSGKEQPVVVQPSANIVIRKNSEEDKQERNYRNVILVKTHLETIPIDISSVCYFFREENNNYLRTWSKEDYIVEYALDELEQTISPIDFFRNNRKMLISFKSCKGFSKTVNGKMEITLAIPYTTEAVTVSYGKQVKFKQWFER